MLIIILLINLNSNDLIISIKEFLKLESIKDFDVDAYSWFFLNGLNLFDGNLKNF